MTKPLAQLILAAITLAGLLADSLLIDNILIHSLHRLADKAFSHAMLEVVTGSTSSHQ